MARVRVHGRIRRVGNSLAFIIPATDARRGGLQAGQAAHADIEADADDALGFLADVYEGPFRRAIEEPKLARD